MKISWKTISISIIFIAIFLALSWLVVQSLITGDIFGFQYGGEEVDFSFFVLIVLFTLLGLILGTLYEYLKSKEKDDISWWRAIFKATSSIRFGMALIVSPLIVLFVFNQVYNQDFNLTVLVFCFQNGFFWERTFNATANR